MSLFNIGNPFFQLRDPRGADAPMFDESSQAHQTNREYFNLPGNSTAAMTALFGDTGPNRNAYNWLRDQAQRYHDAYVATSPFETGHENDSNDFLHYIQNRDPNQEYMNMSPRGRGEMPGLYSPKARYIG